MPKTVIVKKTTLPEFLPHGWKGQVAEVLGIHRNTVNNAIKAGKGTTFEKIKKVAIGSARVAALIFCNFFIKKKV